MFDLQFQSCLRSRNPEGLSRIPELLPVLRVSAIGVGDFVNDAFMLLDERGKLIVGNGQRVVKPGGGTPTAWSAPPQ